MVCQKRADVRYLIVRYGIPSLDTIGEGSIVYLQKRQNKIWLPRFSGTARSDFFAIKILAKAARFGFLPLAFCLFRFIGLNSPIYTADIHTQSVDTVENSVRSFF